MKINKNIIRELNDYLEEFNLTEIEYSEKDIKVKVSKSRISKNTEAVAPANEKKIIKEEVSIDNSNIHENINAYWKILGYVPQNSYLRFARYHAIYDDMFQHCLCAAENNGFL